MKVWHETYRITYLYSQALCKISKYTSKHHFQNILLMTDKAPELRLNCLHLCIVIVDINECMEGNDTCEDTCENIIGSYHCSCSRQGYRLQMDGISCQSELCYCPLYGYDVHNIMYIHHYFRY